MKTMVVALAFACVTPVLQASEINYGYRLGGVRDIAPLQVFDDGANLFMQLAPGRLAAPPVPFAEDGRPVEYELRNPYMVLPIMSRVVLRVGASRATVERMPDGQRSASGVSGRNIWYGAALPAQVTGSAERPVPAASVEVRPLPSLSPSAAGAPKPAEEKVAASAPKPAEEKVAASAPKPAEEKVAASAPNLVGRFTVYGVPASAPPSVERTWTLFAIERPIVSSELAELRQLKGKVVVEADGTADGYAKAASLKSMLEGKNVVIKPRGADGGYIRASEEGGGV